ncbi:ABC transporter permease [Selenomonas sp. AB3002]|uniref:ABC transporter permease n=1 Tax=Selenomonas sp. AB3002 TaxID=1392502 RepID=UPI000495EEE5
MLKNIWHYRHFIYSCVKREFQERYTGSILGILWSVFQPLAMILVYTLVFTEVMKSKMAGMESVPFAYSIYLCAGVLTWNLFNETLMNLVNVFFKNANLMKKVSFPRVCLPTITVLSSFTNFIIGFMLFWIFLIIIGKFPYMHIPEVIIVLLVQSIFTVGLGLGLAVLNVFFRDVGQMLGVVTQFWFWFTPVVYPVAIIPEALRWLLDFNPMYRIIKCYQDIFVYGQHIDYMGLGVVLILGLVLCVWSLKIYQKHVGELVDEL